MRQILYSLPLAMMIFAMPAQAADKHAEKSGGRGAHVVKADKDDRGKGQSQHASQAKAKKAQFDDRDRGFVRSYYSDKHGIGNCPPGLAKKDNGCLPPGQAKKAYVVGEPLPSTVVINPLPPELSRLLTPAPTGYRYGYVDGAVVQYSPRDRLIIDAIDVISRM